MTLSELFVSHKQVDPVKFTIPMFASEQPIYINTDRARKIANGEIEEDTYNWKVGGEDNEDVFNWRVRTEDKQSEESTTPEAVLHSTFTSTIIPHSTTQQQSEESKSKAKSKTGTRASAKWSNNIYKGNKELWIQDMLAAYKKIGLSDNAAKNLLAKNALESGWGQYAQGDFNFGNLTTGNDWQGRYVQGNDKDIDGKRISQKFRAYDSLEDYVKDEVAFLKRLYDFDENDDFETFIYKLQGGNKDRRKYAESRSYATNVRNVYKRLV